MSTSYRILVVGSGGREHALCWRLVQSPLCKKLYCAPGNPGIAQQAELVKIAVDDIDSLCDFVAKNHIDFVVIGPEIPLALGLGDRLRSQGVKVFGPGQQAAQLESSKSFTKEICQDAGIPTAKYGVFTQETLAYDYIDNSDFPLVIKADGLAAGKGVVIAQNKDEAYQAVKNALTGAFGAAGKKLVIEEFLTGPEISYFALVAGDQVIPLSSAQDYKRAFDNDEGPNTGGMGAISPSPLVTAALEKTILDSIITPTAQEMCKRHIPFYGVLYAGLILTEKGPYLLEFNTRFGDPECQLLMLRLASDPVTLLLACDDTLGSGQDISRPVFTHDPAITVVMAAQGYPGSYQKGEQITLPADADIAPHCVIFHAGTALDKQGSLIANGGRVLNISVHANDMVKARQQAYGLIEKIKWAGGFYRTDIGKSV